MSIAATATPSELKSKEIPSPPAKRPLAYFSSNN